MRKRIFNMLMNKIDSICTLEVTRKQLRSRLGFTSHLGLILYFKLRFKYFWTNMLSKINMRCTWRSKSSQGHLNQVHVCGVVSVQVGFSCSLECSACVVDIYVVFILLMLCHWPMNLCNGHSHSILHWIHWVSHCVSPNPLHMLQYTITHPSPTTCNIMVVCGYASYILHHFFIQ